MRVGAVRAAELLEDDARLTAGYYLTADQVALRQLRRYARSTPLARLCEPEGLYSGPIFRRDYVFDAPGMRPYVAPSELDVAEIRPTRFLSIRNDDHFDELTLREGMILITCSGMNLGRVIWTRPSMSGLVASHDLIRVVIDESLVPRGYVHAFLRSRYGRVSIRRLIYGGNIKHVEPHHVARIGVPRFNRKLEKRVDDLIQEAARITSAYEANIHNASERFFESVGLKDISSGEWHRRGRDLGFVGRFSTAASLRALNFNPRFVQLCDAVRSRSWRPLGELCKPGTLKRGGRYKRIDAEPEYSYQLIGQKEVFCLRPEGRWIAKKSVGDDVLVPIGTTVVAARGTFGESELYCRAEFIWGSDAERAYSEDFLRVIAHESMILPGCLFAFMRSETAFRMLRSISMGTKLQDHHPEYLRELPVPYPEKRTREEIHELVVDAYEKRHRSVVLEDEAVSLVEQAIEGGA